MTPEPVCGEYTPPEEGHGRWGCLTCGYARDMHRASRAASQQTAGDTTNRAATDNERASGGANRSPQKGR